MTFSTLRKKDRDDFVYLDHNATSPLAERVAAALPGWLEQWGNPSSIHQSGRGPKALLRQARDRIAQTIGVSPLEIVFTSGGTEANNFALKGVFESFQKPGLIPRPFRNHYLIGAVEHPSVRRAAEALRERGADVDWIPVRRDGSIDLDLYASLVTQNTALVSCMLANNETGNLFPVKEMAAIAHAQGALFHSDCVQALGKIPVNLRELGVDLASFSGHKFYSLKGAGFLFIKKGLAIESLIHGGGQERHRRGGTENVLAIAALGEMCEMRGEIAERAKTLASYRDHLENRIVHEIACVQITGVESKRLPNTSSMLIAGVDGETLLMNLDMRGFAVSTGAACSSGSPEPSPVLLGMGLTREQAQSSLRIGLGWSNQLVEIDHFCDVLKDVVAHLRSFNGAASKALSAHASQGDLHACF